MKNLLTVLMILLSLSAFTQEINKKQLRKELREYRREHFAPEFGSPALESQLKESWKLELQNDTITRFLIAGGRAVGQTYNAAKQHAMETAKLTLAGLVSSRIAGIVESDLSNNSLTREEAKSIDKVVSAYTSFIVQEIGTIRPLVVAFREVGDHNIECAVRIATNAKLTLKNSTDALMDELQKETNLTRQKLEQILDIDRLMKAN